MLKVGDLCVTQNARDAVLNNGLLVTIVAINTARPDGAIYQIRRLDGQPIPSSRDAASGGLNLFKELDVWCVPSKLRRVDPDAGQQENNRELEAVWG